MSGMFDALLGAASFPASMLANFYSTHLLWASSDVSDVSDAIFNGIKALHILYFWCKSATTNS